MVGSPAPVNTSQLGMYGLWNITMRGQKDCKSNNNKNSSVKVFPINGYIDKTITMDMLTQKREKF